MTAQIPETILFRGERVAMLDTPLSQYLNVARVQLAAQKVSSALWRRYVGSWAVSGGRLYLVGLQGTLSDGSALTLEHLFPGFSDRVFAHWFSGRLRLPQGKLLKYVHAGFASTYERDLILRIDQGVLVSEKMRTNGVRFTPGPEGYRLAGATRFINRKSEE